MDKTKTVTTNTKTAIKNTNVKIPLSISASKRKSKCMYCTNYLLFRIVYNHELLLNWFMCKKTRNKQKVNIYSQIPLKI